MMMHKRFLSPLIFSFILCFKRLVAISSRVMFLWSPPGSALGCLLHRLCGLSAALWEEWGDHGHKMPARHISSKHQHWVRISFFERWNASRAWFLPSELYPALPCPGHNSGWLSILLPESICGQWAQTRAIINSLSKCWLPTRPDLCQKYSCPGRLGPIMAQWAGLPGPNTIWDSLNQSPHLKIKRWESIERIPSKKRLAL